jgi:hypothetical protein
MDKCLQIYNLTTQNQEEIEMVYCKNFGECHNVLLVQQ